MKKLIIKIFSKIAIKFKLSFFMNYIYKLNNDPWLLGDKSELSRYEKINEIILKNNNQKLYKNVLEIGAGNGDHSKYLQKITEKLTCLEVSEFACKKLESRLGNNVKIINSSFENYIFRENFDLIIASEVLVYMKDIHLQFEKIEKNSKNFLITYFKPDFNNKPRSFNLEKYNKIEISYNNKNWIIIYN